MPILCSYSTAKSKNFRCGIPYKKSYVFSKLKEAFQAATFDSDQWLTTILSNNLRVISPGNAAAGTPVLFDTNFYQNGTYPTDPNYIEYIWTNPGLSYYSASPLTIQLQDGTTFSGTVDGSNNIVLNQASPSVPGNSVTFTNPGTSSISVSILTQDDTLTTKAGTVTEGQRKEVENLFTQGILAGLVPTTNTLSKNAFQSETSSYFTVNSELQSPPFGTSNNPFYSIYSKVLTSLSIKQNSIYTMNVDEDLYPDVQVSGPYISGESYIGITLGGLN